MWASDTRFYFPNIDGRLSQCSEAEQAHVVACWEHGVKP